MLLPWQHLDVYGGPDDSRRTFDANVTQRDLVGTFLPAFEECASAGSPPAVPVRAPPLRQQRPAAVCRGPWVHVCLQCHPRRPRLCQLSYHELLCPRAVVRASPFVGNSHASAPLPARHTHSSALIGAGILPATSSPTRPPSTSSTPTITMSATWYGGCCSVPGMVRRASTRPCPGPFCRLQSAAAAAALNNGCDLEDADNANVSALPLSFPVRHPTHALT